MGQDAEYPIDARRFREALLDQRRTRMHGGIYHLNQIEMAYNSNRIEGSQLSQDQTRFIYETQTVLGDAPVNDVIEVVNHFRAFDVMLDHALEPITAQMVKGYHRVLKTGTVDADREWFAVGDWKRVANEVGGIETTPPARVASDIDELLSQSQARMTFEEICDFHVRFETIHPFQDGNGRVGRLLLFQQCIANEIMPFIVLDENKAYYYRGLTEYENEPGFLRETFRAAQDAYYARYARFIPPAPTAARTSSPSASKTSSPQGAPTASKRLPDSSTDYGPLDGPGAPGTTPPGMGF